MPVFNQTTAPPVRPGGSGSSQGNPDRSLVEDDTVVNLEVLDVEERTAPFNDNDGNPVVQVSFKFKVVDGSHEGRFFWGNTPNTWIYDERCKLRIWAQEISAHRYSDGEALNTDDLVGKRCRGVISIRTKKADGTKSNFISDVMRDRNAPVIDETF